MAALPRLIVSPLSFFLLPIFLLLASESAIAADASESARLEDGRAVAAAAVANSLMTAATDADVKADAVTVNITETARLETNVLPVDVFVVNTLAFIADEELGLRVLDVTDPADTFEVGRASTPGAASSIVVSGPLALVTDAHLYPITNYGLRIFDISTPAVPLMIGNLDMSTPVYDVIINGSYAMIAAGGSGAIIVDISVPSSPVSIGTADTVGDARSVAVSGNHLYVADGGYGESFGIRVFDITDPALPVQVGNLDLPDDARDIKIVGNLAYVANTYGGLKLVDISDPMLPSIVGTLDTPDRVLDIEIAGSTAFIADYNTGLIVADISNPALPVLVSTMDTGVANNLSLSGSFVHVADLFGGHKIVDAGDINALADAGGLSAPGVFTRLAANGSNVYLADMNLGFRSIDTTSTVNPLLLNNEPIGSSIPGVHFMDIFVQSNMVFVAGVSTVDIFDTTLPQSPVHLGNFNGLSITDIEIADSLVYASDHFDLSIFDVSNLTSPVDRGTLPLPGHARSVAVRGSTVVAGYGSYTIPELDKSGFIIIDVTDPDMPIEIARVDLTGDAQPAGSVEDVVIAGDKLYAVAIGIGMLVYDISNPAVPVETGRLDTISIYTGATISIDGDHAYLVLSPENSRGIEIVDISDPSMPNHLGTYLTEHKPQDIEVIDNVIYLAERRGSLRIATVEPSGTVPTAPENLKARITGPRVVLTWEGSETADEFHVYRKQSTENEFKNIGFTEEYTYYDRLKKCVPSADYYVIAVNEYGESDPSRIATATVKNLPRNCD